MQSIQAAPDILDTLDRDTLERALLATRAFAADLERRLAAMAVPRERHLHAV